ncbi:MAG: DNA-deoxyinosine glycosylase [Arenicellales bacterium WSBS_2016_MAG_OTU3]
MSNPLEAFPPIANMRAKVLILGSMPGLRSLQETQYYANPHNAFWWIMRELLGFEDNLPYTKRINCLKKAGIAVWDVLHSCRRVGSLDSAIEKDSIVVNDFDSFLSKNKNIGAIFFNGQASEKIFLKHAIAMIDSKNQPEVQIRLPSTSPANAGMHKQDKLAAWRVILEYL